MPEDLFNLEIVPVQELAERLDIVKADMLRVCPWVQSEKVPDNIAESEDVGSSENQYTVFPKMMVCPFEKHPGIPEMFYQFTSDNNIKLFFKVHCLDIGVTDIVTLFPETLYSILLNIHAQAVFCLLADLIVDPQIVPPRLVVIYLVLDAAAVKDFLVFQIFFDGIEPVFNKSIFFNDRSPF